MIDRKQCAIIYHTGNSKISYIEENKVTNVLKVLKMHFAKLNITTSKVYLLLGMKVMHLDNRVFAINIRLYFKKTVEEFEAITVE